MYLAVGKALVGAKWEGGGGVRCVQSISRVVTAGSSEVTIPLSPCPVVWAADSPAHHDATRRRRMTTTVFDPVPRPRRGILRGPARSDD